MKKIFKIFLVLLLAGAILAPLVMLAQNPLDRVDNVGEISGLKINTDGENPITIQSVLVNLINYALGFLGLFFLASIIVAGYQWTMSTGDSEKIEKAKARIKNSIIGLVIVLASYTITYFVSNVWDKAFCTFGLDYYCPSPNPNPTGDCRNDLDCERQFGSDNYRCRIVPGHDYGSCLLR